jgi:hypothetical protein
VSLTVVSRETAVRNLARIRGEDKDLFARTRRAIAMLTDQPYPWGCGRVGCDRHIPVTHRQDLDPVRGRC